MFRILQGTSRNTLAQIKLSHQQIEHLNHTNNNNNNNNRFINNKLCNEIFQGFQEKLIQTSFRTMDNHLNKLDNQHSM